MCKANFGVQPHKIENTFQGKASGHQASKHLWSFIHLGTITTEKGNENAKFNWIESNNGIFHFALLQSTKADSDVDDLIALGKKCNQINYWRFPSRTTRCPSHGCSLDFCTRAAAIRHFRECHADSYILCSFCAKPIYAPSIKKMKAHFKAAHPLYPLENDTNDGNQQALSVSDLALCSVYEPLTFIYNCMR